MWFMRVNVVRDLLALAKTEVSAWDTCREATRESKRMDTATLTALDQIADETAAYTAHQVIQLAHFSNIAVPPWR